MRSEMGLKSLQDLTKAGGGHGPLQTMSSGNLLRSPKDKIVGESSDSERAGGGTSVRASINHANTEKASSVTALIALAKPKCQTEDTAKERRRTQNQSSKTPRGTFNEMAEFSSIAVNKLWERRSLANLGSIPESPSKAGR